MKKVKLSLAAFALILAIAGTATANANKSEADPCSEVDPFGIVCLSENNNPCCEDELGNVFFHKNIIEPNTK